MKMREQTIASSIEFKGIGLHTGELATVRILPAPAGKGIIFRRVDLDNFELRADVASVARVAYATTLMSRGVWISTVEHLLSALYGIGIDNAYIESGLQSCPIRYRHCRFRYRTTPKEDVRLSKSKHPGSSMSWHRQRGPPRRRRPEARNCPDRHGEKRCLCRRELEESARWHAHPCGDPFR